MPRDRRAARVLAMQALCQQDVQGAQDDEVLLDFFANLGAEEKAMRYAIALMQAFLKSADHYDELIDAASPRWQLARISPVERNAMRIAAAELFEGDVPPKVAINEAIEIAREFGGADSPRFVNGVLDEVYRKNLKDFT